MNFSVLNVHGELDIYYLIPNRLTPFGGKLQYGILQRIGHE